jgi:hypothetical protein
MAVFLCHISLGRMLRKQPEVYQLVRFSLCFSKPSEILWAKMYSNGGVMLILFESKCVLFANHLLAIICLMMGFCQYFSKLRGSPAKKLLKEFWYM